MADRTANRVLTMNILMFALCFAAWTLFGVLVTFLVDHRELVLDKSQIGWLMGAPILTGSVMRLPIGLLSDRLGGKVVTIAIMLVGAFGLFLVSRSDGFTSMLVCGLVFGLTGATFASGVALTSSWFPKERQGTALGLLGLGNIGTAITALSAPNLLKWATKGGTSIEGWRLVPQIYAVALIVMAVAFAFLVAGKPQSGPPKTLAVLLKPLAQVRVWRFGLYYFLVFGGFVALSQWLIPYSLNVYGLSLASAGVLSTMFSAPSAITRAIGGLVSDRFGARTTLYCVLSGILLLFILLVMPRMDITSPGEGVLADRQGIVTYVGPDKVTVDATDYRLRPAVAGGSSLDSSTIVWPQFNSWHEPIVKVGESVGKKQVLARGVTHIYFQANRTVFTVLLLLAGVMMGLGMAAVFKHIPEYFPNDVPVVGGLVGVLGGLGGFVLPIVFGYVLKSSGVWTTCFVLLAALAAICLAWMHAVIVKSASAHERTLPDAQVAK